jgi:hypothetical protein
LPTGYAESVRRGYDSQRAACPAQILAPLDACATRLESIVAQQDPAAARRREAARPRAETTKQAPQWKALIDEWMTTFDGMKIVCRAEQVSDSHRRECERRRHELDGVYDELRAYLTASGFDPRDFAELGLWPSDPDPMGS